MKSSDKLAIHELLSRAAYSFDERKLDMLERCFTSEATMLVDITGIGEVGPFEGREAIMKLMSDTLASQTDVRRHVISNFFFEAFAFMLIRLSCRYDANDVFFLLDESDNCDHIS